MLLSVSEMFRTLCRQAGAKGKRQIASTFILSPFNTLPRKLFFFYFIVYFFLLDDVRDK